MSRDIRILSRACLCRVRGNKVNSPLRFLKFRVVVGIYDLCSLLTVLRPTRTTVGSRGVTKVAFQNLFREISGLRSARKKSLLSPLIARSTGMSSVPPWETEVNDPRKLPTSRHPCSGFVLFPFLSERNTSVEIRGQANGGRTFVLSGYPRVASRRDARRSKHSVKYWHAERLATWTAANQPSTGHHHRSS